MDTIETFRFATQRLLIDEWYSMSPQASNQLDLGVVVQSLLTARVTEPLPPAWQGVYTLERAEQWVVERDQEGTTLIVVEKQTKHPIGLVILHSSCSKTDIRLGYMLSESVWGKGLASELIQGLVAWGSRHKINSFIGGVGLENKASKRVLEKNGFFVVPQQGNKDEILLQFVF